MYNLPEYIERSKNKDKKQLLIDLQKEIAYAEGSASSGIKGKVQNREMGALQYANDLKGLVFL
jgi:hypothetical protein